MPVLRKKIDIHFVHIQDVNWATIRNVDVVYMQRPSSPNNVRILEIAMMNKKKVWVDYDDYLLGVPPWNPAYNTYANPGVQDNIKLLLKHSDVITVSTKFLKLKLSEFNEKIHVVPNAFDDTVLKFKDDNTTLPIITWRGSQSHDKDLAQFTPALVSIARENLAWNFVFMGEPFWKTVEEIKSVNQKCAVVPTKDPIFYFKAFQSMKPAIHIVPLLDDDFNRSKSNIAWIEATFAGAASLVPDTPEWQVPGVMNYKDEKDFQYKLQEMMKEYPNTYKRNLESRKYIEENLMLTNVTNQRLEILKSLL